MPPLHLQGHLHRRGLRRWTGRCSGRTAAWSRLCSTPSPGPSTPKSCCPGWRSVSVRVGRLKKKERKKKSILCTPGTKLVSRIFGAIVDILELKSDKYCSDDVDTRALPLADIECAKSYAKMAESAKTLASQQVGERHASFKINK